VGSAHERPIAEAGVDRTAFYGSRPYAHLRSEFEQCLEELRHADERPDPRDAQVARLKDEITRLKEQAAQSDATISDLAGFRGQALARLAAQHDEITRLRQEVRLAADLRRVPAPAPSAKEQNPVMTSATPRNPASLGSLPPPSALAPRRIGGVRSGPSLLLSAVWVEAEGVLLPEYPSTLRFAVLC
jgi:hypothetical protein